MDKRKNNGGNSTKAKGFDKRKRNEYKNALDTAADLNDVVKVIEKVKSKAIEGDLNACKLFLEYYLGKPTQTIEQKNTHTLNDFSIKSLYDTETQK